ncbi:hypothetical protein [Burkholderia phage BCSR129]|nr:hypothetical protein [Burkholderia phage BCSR129]
MSKYILSTMSDNVSYNVYDKSSDLPVVRKQVTILGGANKASLNSGFGDMVKNSEGIPLWTPAGMVTPITDADYEAIKDNAVFRRHMERRFIQLLDKDPGRDHDKVSSLVQTMTPRDRAAPLTPDTVKSALSRENGHEPTVAAGDDKEYDGNIKRIKK